MKKTNNQFTKHTFETQLRHTNKYLQIKAVGENSLHSRR